MVWVAVIGAVIELGVAVAAVINVHKEMEESRKEKLEKYIEVFACIAAFFFMAEAILGWRSSMLLGKELERLKADNLKLYAKIQPRRISPEKRTMIIADLKAHPPPTNCLVFVQAEYVTDVEETIFASEILSVLTNGMVNANSTGNISVTGSTPRFFGALLIVPYPPPIGWEQVVEPLVKNGVIETNCWGFNSNRVGSIFIDVGPKRME